MVSNLTQCEHTDRGSEANPEVKPNCRSSLSFLFLPVVVIMTQKTETEVEEGESGLLVLPT